MFYTKHCRNNTLISGFYVMSTIKPLVGHTSVDIIHSFLYWWRWSFTIEIGRTQLDWTKTWHVNIRCKWANVLWCTIYSSLTGAQFENKVHRSLENENSDITHFCSVLLYIRNRTAVFYASQASSARPSKDTTYYDYDEYGLICSYPCTKVMFKLTY
jgi:hypothetical protein